eukprot:GFUD01039847.1.p1 GENE.GFUD01039847.1~~GFUD01039847.1.p1  ORF type:complete len:328 (+),score=68.62 GFUD01039847.1:37-1020(+)
MFLINRHRQVGSIRSPLARLVSSTSSLSIPVPWGSIAAVQWTLGDGPYTDWVAVHGLLDNAGTFNKIIPGLPEGIRVTCIDLPGHGLSSKLAAGSLYYMLDHVATLQRVKDYLGMEKCVLLGHSMGGWICGLYAAIMPEQVLGLVSIDGIKPISRYSDGMIPRIREYFGTLEKLEAKRNEKGMSEEEAFDKLFKGTNMLHGQGAITEEAARCLLTRGIIKSASGSGFVFTRDIKHILKDLYGIAHEYNTEFAANIRCPHLLVRASAENAATAWGKEKEAMEEVLSIYNRNKLFTLADVLGSHHVHLNNPERVLPHIDTFVRCHQLSN